MKKKNRKNLVAQSRQLIEGRYNFTLWELRLYLKMVEMIDKDDKSFKEYRIYFKDLINEYGGKSKDEYKLIHTSAKRLLKKLVKLHYTDSQGHNRCVETHLLAAVDYPDNWREKDENSYLELSFAPQLKPYLLDLKGNFLLYDRRNILLLKSKFSVRIYQLLKSHERQAKDTVIVEYEVKELRNMLLVDDEGNPTNEYSKHSMFKKRVLLQAQKELKEHTDIAFSFDEIKKGKRIDIIRFFIKKNRKKGKKNEPQQLTLEIPKTTTPQPTQKPKTQPQKPIQKAPQPKPTTAEAPVVEKPKYHNRAYQKLIDIGVAAPTAYELVKSHHTPYIIASIRQAQQTHQASPKTNFAGFVISCIQKGTYKEIVQKQQAKKIKEQARQKRQNAHYQIMDIRNTYIDKRKKYVKEFRSQLDEKTTAEIIQKARDENKQAKDMTDKGIQEGRYFEYGFVSYFNDKGEFPTEFVSFDNYMQKYYSVKISQDNNDGWYEVVG